MFAPTDAAFEELFVREMGLLDPLDQRLSLVDRLNLSHVEALQGLHEDVVDLESGVAAWERIKAKVKATGQEWMEDKLNEVVLAYVWPRIDENVSLHRNHLLKSFFVAHPKTGRIAMPVCQEVLFDFRPGSSALSIHSWPLRVHECGAEPQALPRVVEKKQKKSEAKRRKSSRLTRGASRKPSPLVPQPEGAMDIEDLGAAVVS